MIVLVDIDGVLADLAKQTAFIVGYEGVITTWEMHDLFTDAQKDIFLRAWTTPGFWEYLPPIDGAIEGLYQLIQKYEVFICSTPYLYFPLSAKEKLLWVKKHFGTGVMKRTILTHDKTLVQGDILIDDKPTIEGINVPSWEHVIFDQPYNQQTNGFRLSSWYNIDRLFDYIRDRYG